MKRPAPDPARLSAGVTARFAIGSIGTGGFGTLPGLVLVYYLTDTLGVSALLAGLAFALAKLWDIVIDPVIGAATDREFARTGGRSRLMIIGGVAMVVFFPLTFAVPGGLPPLASGLWVLVGFILSATSFSLFQVPYMGIPAELTSSYHERTRLLSMRVIVLSLAILLFGGGGPELRKLGGDDEALGYLLMSIVAAIVLAAGFLVSASIASRRHLTAGTIAAPAAAAPSTNIGEHYRRAIAVLRDSQPHRVLVAAFALQALATGLMLAGAQYVATWVLHDEDAVTYLFVALIAPAIVLTPVWQLVSRRLGKTRGFTIATLVFVVATLAQVILVWAPGPWIYVTTGLVGAAYSGLQALPMAMLPDVIAVDARSGTNRAGAFSATWTAAETLAMTLGTTILTIVLTATGYLESTAGTTLAQPSSAVVGIALTFSIVPAVLAGLSLLAIRRYPLTERDVDPVATAGVNG